MLDEIRRLKRKEMLLRAKAKALDAHTLSLRKKSLRWWAVVRKLEGRRLELEKHHLMGTRDVRVRPKLQPRKRKPKPKEEQLKRLWEQVMGDVPLPKGGER